MTKVTKERCKKRYKQRLPANATQRTKATKKTAYVCNGGPWDGETLYLTTPQTLPINVKGFRGRYVEKVTLIRGTIRNVKFVWEDL